MTIVALTVTVGFAEVVVIANRTPRVVKFGVAVGDSKPFMRSVDPGDLTTVTCGPGERVRAAFLVGDQKRNYLLTTNAAYFFYNHPKTNELDLHEIELLNRPAEAPAAPTSDPAPSTGQASTQPPAPPIAASSATPAAETLPGAAAKTKPAHSAPRLTKVKVKILVDDDEHAVRAIWEERFRKRIANASKILEVYAGITLEIVAFDTWITDNQIHDFPLSLLEFERKVSADPADVAIGFSSQYQLTKGRTHLGGTRGALAPHILIREWSRQITEPERLEVLVHELGHRFGAVHSPEMNSVMRPILGDRKSVARGFRILFDPLNTLAIRLLSEEMREHGIKRLEEVSPATRRNLVAVYSTLAKAFPEDPAAGHYLVRLGEPPPPGPRPVRKVGAATLVESARVVRDAVVECGDRNRRLPDPASLGEGEARLDGDKLTEKYVRVAATAALTLPEKIQAKAFGLGLGVALTDTDQWSNSNISRDLLPQVETASDRDRRRAVIGKPTMLGRDDLAKHFFLCNSLASVSSPTVAESAGLLKELQDSQGKSGFSFADLAADLAGIAFLAHAQQGPAALKEISQSFTIDAYMPSIADLPEGLQSAAFRERYGSLSDPRFKAELEKVRARLRDLPVYKEAPAATPSDSTPSKSTPDTPPATAGNSATVAKP